jgi:cation diffusion facilitator family transporter
MEDFPCRIPNDLDRGRSHSRKVLMVLLLTAVTFGVEIVFGCLTGSLALTADAWHMLTHLFALSINMLGFVLSARYARDRRFSFGVGKFSALTGYTSALILLAIAGWLVVESLWRFWQPRPVAFGEALVVAAVGLVVNLVSARILSVRPENAPMSGTSPDHHHGQDHHHPHHDHNLRSAYLHVLSDALTSVLAIVALACGLFFHWVFMDAATGLVAAVVIVIWAVGMIKASGLTLLDAHDDSVLEGRVLAKLRDLTDLKLVDFHLWPAGVDAYYLMVSLQGRDGTPVRPSVQEVKGVLGQIHELKHVTVEIL